MTRYVFYSFLVHTALLLVLFLRPFDDRTRVYYGFDFIPGGSSGFGPAPLSTELPAPPSEGQNTVVAPPTPPKNQEPPAVQKKAEETPNPNKVQVAEKTKQTKKETFTKAVPKQKVKGGPAQGTEKPRARHGTAPASGTGDTGGMGMGLDIGGVGLGSGGGGISKDFPYPWYVKTLRRKLWQAWDSKYNSDKECVVGFVIRRDGSVDNIDIDRGSGDSIYDDMAIRAVELAAPFPPLPEGYGKSSIKIYVNFKFEQ